MAMTQLTQNGYILNHWITVTWVSMAALYTYWAIARDMLNFFKRRAGKTLEVD